MHEPTAASLIDYIEASAERCPSQTAMPIMAIQMMLRKSISRIDPTREAFSSTLLIVLNSASMAIIG